LLIRLRIPYTPNVTSDPQPGKRLQGLATASRGTAWRLQETSRSGGLTILPVCPGGKALFIQLGLTNTLRNLSRSMLSVIAVAVAAMALTGMVTLASGYRTRSSNAGQAFAEGEIMIFPYRLNASAAGSSGKTTEQMRFMRLDRDWVSELMIYRPESFLKGAFAAGRPTFDAAEITARLREFPFIAGIHPYCVLPAVERWFDNVDNYERMGLAALRGRDTWRDDRVHDFSRFVAFGRYLAVVDDGLMRSALDANRSKPADAYGPIGQHLAFPPDGKITVDVPAMNLSGSFDYSTTRSFKFRVVGAFNLQQDARLPGSEQRREQGPDGPTLATPQILVPMDVFMGIWNEVTGGAPLRVPQVSVTTRGALPRETVVRKLQEALPEYTVTSVVAETSAIGSRSGRALAPPLVRSLLIVLTGSVSYLMVAANNLIALAGRRKEIGILRAVGARRADIMAMILAEVVAVTVAGTLLGFGLSRIRVIAGQIAADLPAGTIIFSTLLDGGVVCGAALVGSLLFGLAPALRGTATSTMEVLRRDA
jgi:hypothetical protein